jgi:hypothetical protein
MLPVSSAPDLERPSKFELHRDWLVLVWRKAREVVRVLSAFIILGCE